MVQDFGENRKASYAQEIKSAHFGKTQITVHPVVCYFRSGDEVVRESHIFLSDDIKHDHGAVNEFTLRSLELIQKKMRVSKLTMWSDGAASQYKGNMQIKFKYWRDWYFEEILLHFACCLDCIRRSSISISISAV